MTGTNYDAQIAEKEIHVADAAAATAKLRAENAALQADGRVEGTAARTSRIEDLQVLIKAINDGTLGRVGIPLDLRDLLQPLVGRPSPSILQEQIAELRAAREAAAAQPSDPNAIAG